MRLHATNKVGPLRIWLWVAIKPRNGEILAKSISKEPNTIVADQFLSKIAKELGKHPVSTDRRTVSTDMQTQNLNHINSPHEKIINERTMLFAKERTECYDDHFPCPRER